MAAESYFRVNSLPCILHTTSGPGGTNAITGVTGAWIDSIPMFVISGQVPTQDMINNTKTRQIGVQEINIIDIVKPITKYSHVLRNPEEIDTVLNKAYEKMLGGRPGPVWIDVPLDIQSKLIDVKKIKKQHPQISKKIHKKIDFKKIYKLINESNKPIIIIGNGIHISKSEKVFIKLARKLNIPIISSWNASDVIETKDDLYIGRMGIFGERSANLAVESSDLLIVLGSRISVPQSGYRKNFFSVKSKKIFVDIDKAEMDSKKFKNIKLKINSDLNYFIKKALLFFKKKKIKKFINWQKLVTDWKKTYPVIKKKYPLMKKNINSFQFIGELSKNLRGNETIVTDMGTSFTCSMQSFSIKKPLKQRLFTSSGLASMGFGLPGIIGAYFADNNKNPICLSGEGGLMFNIQELQTIKNYKIPLKLFILENKGYLTMKLMQKKNFKRLIGSDPNSGLTFPSFQKIAKSFDFKYIKLKSKNISSQIKKIIKLNKPTIIEINMPPFQELIPRVQNRLNKDGTFLVPKLDDLYPHLLLNVLNKERNKAKNIK
jgi:acetolactate synthase-1/2/3 large subunit